VLQALVTSKVRVKLLTLLLMHPEQEYYLKGLVRELGENNNSLRRELNRLEQVGLLRSVRRGGAKYYSVNRDHPIYPELKSVRFGCPGRGGSRL
jgi:predicted transcriptional regulator with HTH domain